MPWCIRWGMSHNVYGVRVMSEVINTSYTYEIYEMTVISRAHGISHDMYTAFKWDRGDIPRDITCYRRWRWYTILTHGHLILNMYVINDALSAHAVSYQWTCGDKYSEFMYHLHNYLNICQWKKYINFPGVGVGNMCNISTSTWFLIFKKLRVLVPHKPVPY